MILDTNPYGSHMDPMDLCNFSNWQANWPLHIPGVAVSKKTSQQATFGRAGLLLSRLQIKSMCAKKKQLYIAVYSCVVMEMRSPSSVLMSLNHFSDDVGAPLSLKRTDCSTWRTHTCRLQFEHSQCRKQRSTLCLSKGAWPGFEL